MKVNVLASSKSGYNLPLNNALISSGHYAGICYLPDSIETLKNEDPEKTLKRVSQTLSGGHHSVYDHVQFTLLLEDIPKILAIVLNNEKVYTTSEKSGRYTKMATSGPEAELYNKWLKIYRDLIQSAYPNMKEKQVEKLAMENARCVISVFTPATTMAHTMSLRQINYIMNFMEEYIETCERNAFNSMLIPWFKDFCSQLSELKVPELVTTGKNRQLSLFATRHREFEWGESYSTNYMGSWVHFAQAQRHRTLNYEIELPETPSFYVPKIITSESLKEEWLKDMAEIQNNFPQAMLIKINERGTVENFVQKCYERLCGHPQLEITLQTKETLEHYISNTSKTNPVIADILVPLNQGARCKFGWKCNSPCFCGPNQAFSRLI